ncbi:hypothetical protein O181_131702 [Austropuccinia psidii MF-1]|uniref:Transposase n=1 Tax=Austropuccinia psidii MF-1 TaxID=1389203 RepID=A0A9Q3L3K5_9BASI|nr:hypothetical protein [Austropuccinia psidii MF-1]
MYQKEASEAFNISSWQVYRILHENPGEKKQYKKCEGKINYEMKTNLLYFIERKSTVTLKEMKLFLEENFPVKISCQSIRNLLNDMDITWKKVTNILSYWNKPNLLSQNANFVNQKGFEIYPKIIFVDESGFDLHSGSGFGYSQSGLFFCFVYFFDILNFDSENPAVLSLVPKVKQITLIAAMSNKGFVYHELLNANGQMTKGIGSDEFVSFFLALQLNYNNGKRTYPSRTMI